MKEDKTDHPLFDLYITNGKHGLKGNRDDTGSTADSTPMRKQNLIQLEMSFRRAKKEGKLSEAIINELDNIGFDWNPRVAKPGVNDLASQFPEIAAEWHPSKNGALKPSDVIAKGSQKVWWLCPKGHEYQMPVKQRTHAGNGCPFCSGHRVLAGFNDIATLYPEIAAQWHYEKNGDLLPSMVSKGSQAEVWWLCPNGHEYKRIVNRQIRKGRNACPYCSKKVVPGDNDLKSVRPDLALEWHPSKNHPLWPDQIEAESYRKVWWLCPSGHEYQSCIRNRVQGGVGCPVCSNRRLKEGINDLATLYPELVEEWNVEKNKMLPSQVTPGIPRKYWWTCPNGHDYESAIAHRTSRGSGCPYCKGKRVLAGFNDLQSKYPDIAAQWHPTRNGNLKPTEVTSGSSRKVWWLCEKGHDFEAAISKRTIEHTSCPYCAGQKLIPGFNDLASQRPDIAAEWHPTKNGSLTPAMISKGSSREKIWWLCPEGHEYCATVSKRTAENAGCPYCKGRKTLSGFNDLASRYPDIAKEWHPTKNGNLKPTDVTKSSNKSVWWLCEKSHEWEQSINARTINHSPCPYCSHKRVIEGENDFETLNPEVAAEWDMERNAPLKPSQVFPGSQRCVYWKCSKCGTSWQARVIERNRGRQKCPHCRNGAGK